jgi:hypothetical protein
MESADKKCGVRKKKVESEILSPCVIQREEETLCCTKSPQTLCAVSRAPKAIEPYDGGEKTLCNSCNKIQTLAPQGKAAATKINVIYDIGYGNTLYIRGKGGGLSWDRGIAMANESPDRWSWSSCSSDGLEFKLLINDNYWENGFNHRVYGGSSQEIHPHF